MKLLKVLLATIPLWIGMVELAPAKGLPLQAGVYRAGSRFIQIAAKGTRLCYRGASVREWSVASISTDKQYPGMYRLDSNKNFFLYQESMRTLYYGILNNMIPMQRDDTGSQDIDAVLQKCLNSSASFAADSSEASTRNRDQRSANITSLAKIPSDGRYTSSYPSDDIFFIKKGKYEPYIRRGNTTKLSDFQIVTDNMLLHKASGRYYCNIDRLTYQGSSLLQSTTRNGMLLLDYPWEGYNCMPNGWVYYKNPR